MVHTLKKLVAVFTLIFLIFSSFIINRPTDKTFAEKVYYARISYENVYLYRTASENNDYANLYFKLPRSYFVKLTGESGDFFSAEYIDISGFVLKSQVQCIKEVPQKAYLTDITYSIVGNSNCRIRYEPNTRLGSYSQVGLIPLNDNTPVYYGSIDGDLAIASGGTIWYYTKYVSSQNTVYGYVYAFLTGNLTKITDNTETVTILDSISFTEQNNQNTGLNLVQIFSSTEQIIIIVLMAIPAVILIYLLFKPSRTFNKSTIKRIEKPKNNDIIIPHKRTFGDIDKSLDFDDDL
ncbi:MAG: hypothetical protein WC942_04700 [Clostridia bacterium]|jgi:hypothetical protein